VAGAAEGDLAGKDEGWIHQRGGSAHEV